MSSDYYFNKWNKTLRDLEAIVNLDISFQQTKAHDKKRCHASQRLSGVLGEYMAIYNSVWDCLHQNLQVQKTSYMHDVLKAVVSRILELKHELRKLEFSEYHFNCNGLVLHKLTPLDAELIEIPEKVERADNVRDMLRDIFEQVKEKKRKLEEEAAKAEEEEEIILIDKWWEYDEVEESEEDLNFVDEKKENITEEQQAIKRMVELIQSHEKTRQVITHLRQKQNKRERWEKDLRGILAPPPSLEMKDKSAKIIQKVCRAYFECKRQKILQCKRDELLGFRPGFKTKLENKEQIEQVQTKRKQLKRKYDEEWKTEFESLKQDYIKRKADDIREDNRDYIRDWFRIWFEAVQFFHDIPKEKEGGAILIFKDELPTPEEWLEEYKNFLANKKANKNMTAINKKIAKMEAKLEEMALRKEEHIKKRLEEELRRKMMKNPTMHPGFEYPESKKIKHLLEAITNYRRDWDELDVTGTLDVKEKHVIEINRNIAYMEAKIEIVSTVENHMRNELKLLKKALKKDYENIGAKMPEQMKQKHRKGKKKQKVKKTLNENIAEKLEDMVFRGYLTEYPHTKIEEFIGDPNFTGDDMRCNYEFAIPHNGETRNIWWEKCRELVHGFHRILLVGPKGCGKNKLVHVLASMNDAVLFELDPGTLSEKFVFGVYLDQLIRSIAASARAVQPSVIHIKHVHRLFYRKVPPAEKNVDWKLLQRYFVKKLFKHIQKADKITVIGTCVDPWVTKSKQILKQFPTVVLLPTASYGTVVEMLKDWVLSHTVIPPDLDVSSLAHVLQEYTFGYLKSVLEKFLSADTIVRIAARGLSPMEVYDFILQEEIDGKVDYTKYLKWYSENTSWGKKEQKHLAKQREFKQAMEDYTQKMEKKKQKRNLDRPHLARKREETISK